MLCVYTFIAFVLFLLCFLRLRSPSSMVYADRIVNVSRAVLRAANVGILAALLLSTPHMCVLRCRYDDDDYTDTHYITMHECWPVWNKITHAYTHNRASVAWLMSVAWGREASNVTDSSFFPFVPLMSFFIGPIIDSNSMYTNTYANRKFDFE